MVPRLTLAGPGSAGLIKIYSLIKYHLAQNSRHGWHTVTIGSLACKSKQEKTCNIEQRFFGASQLMLMVKLGWVWSTNWLKLERFDRISGNFVMFSNNIHSGISNDGPMWSSPPFLKYSIFGISQCCVLHLREGEIQVIFTIPALPHCSSFHFQNFFLKPLVGFAEILHHAHLHQTFNTHWEAFEFSLNLYPLTAAPTGQ